MSADRLLPCKIQLIFLERLRLVSKPVQKQGSSCQTDPNGPPAKREQ
jgi:hypothetical protein